MTPLPLLSVPASQEPHQPSPELGSDRPERSRNAKAQARHRAKRKAYIHQLEQTVVRLQQALQLSPDQHVAPIPPPVRVRELEEENIALHREIDLLRRQLDERNARLRPDINPRSPDASPLDTRTLYDRDYKHRQFSYDDGMQGQTSPTSQVSSPTNLSMPGLNYSYSHSPASPSMGQDRSSPLPAAPTYGYPYHMPETPPSSSTSTPSTPSFSPTDHYANYTQRAPLPSAHASHQTYQQGAVGHYGSVKVEEDPYVIPQPSHDMAHANGYANAISVYSTSHHAISQWSYPDRGQAHETYERIS
ncbi:bZIP transcription factor [Phanerochaete sordida]|uniref:BZIP transcription factor n=1 Tax=Phanerochaete sordida TaxID=48140 RepID=A0A9P3G175_9APHY|nr:bZIP transcription factor [Phanerochaete sordida]